MTHKNNAQFGGSKVLHVELTEKKLRIILKRHSSTPYYWSN